jgi:integrase
MQMDAGLTAAKSRRAGGAIRRAGLEPELTPHNLRHTWASWHYALNRNLLALKIEGGWSPIALVKRYLHPCQRA